LKLESLPKSGVEFPSKSRKICLKNRSFRLFISIVSGVIIFSQYEIN